MKQLLATLVACTALLAHSSAQAANGCYGCNVADEKVLNSSLIGATIYVGGARGVATQIDPSSGKVYVNLADGRSGWANAAETYTYASQQERVKLGVLAFVVGGCLLLCGSGSSHQTGASGSTGQSASPPCPMQPSWRDSDGVMQWQPTC